MKEKDYINVQILTELRCIRAILNDSLVTDQKEGKEAMYLIVGLINKYEKKIR